MFLSGLVVMCVLFGIPMTVGAQPAAKDAPTYVQPAENLMLIVADLQRHLNDDTYRFPVATDVTGQNVFRATVARLANYQTLYPDKMRDLVSMAMAQAFEKLGDYALAVANYETAKASPDPQVAKAAEEGQKRALRFVAVVNQQVDQTALRPYERDMKKKIADLDALAAEFRGTPWQSQALLERERADLQMAQFYTAMRFMQPYTTEDAVKQLKGNLDRYKDSKNRYLHHLLLADFHFLLAREYTLLHDPDGPEFSMRAFEGFSDPARSEYRIVEQADGYPEKLEARAKMMALEAFVESVTEKAR